MVNWQRRITKIVLDWFDLVVFLVFVLGVILFIRFFIWTPYTVVGYSMNPTFDQGDRIFVEKITQRFWTLERGDVIVFVPPGKNIPFIKRIIGLPGETVKFVDNQTYICNSDTRESTIKSKNGNSCFKLDESYLGTGAETIPQQWWDEFEVKGGYFAMGDNRWHTTDSLHCFSHQCYKGANYVVPSNYMIGRVMFRVFPKAEIF